MKRIVAGPECFPESVAERLRAIADAYPDVEVDLIDGDGTIADARFLSHVERTFADALEPLGYRVDRRIGVHVGGLRFQPTLTVMPLAPAEPDADYHQDFVGAIEIARPGDKSAMAWRRARACGQAPGCRFVVLVSRDEPWVEVMTPESEWRLVPAQGVVEILGVTVPVARLYR